MARTKKMAAGGQLSVINAPNPRGGLKKPRGDFISGSGSYEPMVSASGDLGPSPWNIMLHKKQLRDRIAASGVPESEVLGVKQGGRKLTVDGSPAPDYGAENQMRMKKGGKVDSASKRADGIAQRGKTKGRMI
jgi:hypothetical protein